MMTRQDSLTIALAVYRKLASTKKTASMTEYRRDLNYLADVILRASEGENGPTITRDACQ